MFESLTVISLSGKKEGRLEKSSSSITLIRNYDMLLKVMEERAFIKALANHKTVFFA